MDAVTLREKLGKTSEAWCADESRDLGYPKRWLGYRRLG